MDNIKLKFFRDKHDILLYSAEDVQNKQSRTSLDLDGNIQYLELNGKFFDYHCTQVVPCILSLTTNRGEDIPFECECIEYPADDRLTPLRHFDSSRINYFEVDGYKVACDFAVSLCEEEGLKDDNKGQDVRTYTVHSYGRRSIHNWEIEGKRFRHHIDKVRVSDSFEGDLNECLKYIGKIETAIRLDFNEWFLHHRKIMGLTVDFVTTHLDRIRGMMRGIESKKRTIRSFNATLAAIDFAREEVLKMAIREKEENENI